MGNKKQLEILKQGAKIWNKWRRENYEIINLNDTDLFKINLENVNLQNAKLENANLTNANLTNANLIKANLINSKLGNANLVGANLGGANLGGANLNNANLSYTNLLDAFLYDANLSNTNLFNANLIGANLSSADLSNADLSNAELSNANLVMTKLDNVCFQNCNIGITTFGLTNLSTVKGLSTVKVSYECTIDFQTLRDSKNIPKEFLLKIGLSDNYINYLPDFYDSSAIRMFPVFLSHSWGNKEFAGKLYDALIKKGVIVWYDEKKLRAGDKIFEGLTKAIDVYDKMILVCSKESLEESWWVDEEMNRIFKKERTYLKEKKKNVSLLIPITIDDHIFKWEGAKGESIRDKVIGDFSEWEDDVKFEKALNELIEALNVDREKENITSFL